MSETSLRHRHPVIQDIVDSLEKLTIKVYMVYPDNDQAKKPAIHIHTKSIQKRVLVELVNCIGRYNLAVPDNTMMVLKPHNYGDWESYLSLEPMGDCSSEELKTFSEFLRVSIEYV